LRELTHLGGHHGKSTAGLARSCGLHSRVQGQDVGLESDAVDDLDDFTHTLGAGLELTHRLHGFAHQLATAFRLATQPGGQLVQV
jgi:hypothetical protein